MSVTPSWLHTTRGYLHVQCDRETSYEADGLNQFIGEQDEMGDVPELPYSDEDYSEDGGEYQPDNNNDNTSDSDDSLLKPSTKARSSGRAGPSGRPSLSSVAHPRNAHSSGNTRLSSGAPLSSRTPTPSRIRPSSRAPPTGKIGAPDESLPPANLVSSAGSLPSGEELSSHLGYSLNPVATNRTMKRSAYDERQKILLDRYQSEQPSAASPFADYHEYINRPEIWSDPPFPLPPSQKKGKLMPAAVEFQYAELEDGRILVQHKNYPKRIYVLPFRTGNPAVPSYNPPEPIKPQLKFAVSTKKYRQRMQRYMQHLALNLPAGQNRKSPRGGLGRQRAHPPPAGNSEVPTDLPPLPSSSIPSHVRSAELELLLSTSGAEPLPQSTSHPFCGASCEEDHGPAFFDSVSDTLSSSLENSLLNGTAWKDRETAHLPDDFNPFRYYNTTMPANALETEVNKLFPGPIDNCAPPDGWWLLPVPKNYAYNFPPSYKNTSDVKDTNGPKYLAWRSPANMIPRSAQDTLQRCMALTQGDQDGLKALKVHCKKSLRSDFPMVHLGLMGQYSQDKIGPGNLQPSRDTRDQEQAMQHDLLKRTFLSFCEQVAPVITNILRAIDPLVMEFTLAVRQRLLATHHDYMRSHAGDFRGPFCSLAVSVGYSEFTHVDRPDFCKTYAIVIPVGPYEGGNTVLPTLNWEIPLQPGQVLGFCASFLPHHCAPITKGNRYVATCFTDKCIAKKTSDLLVALGRRVTDLNFNLNTPWLYDGRWWQRPVGKAHPSPHAPDPGASIDLDTC